MINAKKIKLLIAASGTGGHLFPAIALAEKLSDYDIQWLGVPHRLETELKLPYTLNIIDVEGFQQGLSLASLRTLFKLIKGILTVRKLIKRENFQAVFTTGGYIAGPTILAARSLGLPVIFHESNALPGKVTRFFGPWCDTVAIGFEVTSQYLPKTKTVCLGTPVRSQFLEESQDHQLDLPIPDGVPLIVVFGGSQGAVAINKLVRESAQSWFDAGAYIVHLTGDKDPDMNSLQHPQYIALPFYDQMAGLLKRANLAISRSGAGSLTELAVCGTPAILIPYPFAAEDHQSYNAAVFSQAGAAITCEQSELSKDILTETVLRLLKSPTELTQMGERAKAIAIPDSAERLASLVRKILE